MTAAAARSSTPNGEVSKAVSVATAELISLLQMAYSGERAAAYAYLGHRKSLRKQSEAADRAMLTTVLIEEIQHRRIVRNMLKDLGAGPDKRRDAKMLRIGRTIGALCLISGWFCPMYGAGRLESRNVVEYEVAARLAKRAGLPAMAEILLQLAEVEWDHEFKFRSRAESHILWKLIPHWKAPPPRVEIRRTFDDFVVHDLAVPDLRWTPLR